MKFNSKDVYLNYAAVVKVESRKEFTVILLRLIEHRNHFSNLWLDFRQGEINR